MKTQIEREAAELTTRREFRFTEAGLRRRLEKAFLEGARAVRQQASTEAERLLINLKPGISDFERGQADGVRWLQDCIDQLFDND